MTAMPTTHSRHRRAPYCQTNCSHTKHATQQRHHSQPGLHTPRVSKPQTHDAILPNHTSTRIHPNHTSLATYSRCRRLVSDDSDVDIALAPSEPILFLRILRPRQTQNATYPPVPTMLSHSLTYSTSTTHSVPHPDHTPPSLPLHANHTPPVHNHHLLQML